LEAVLAGAMSYAQFPGQLDLLQDDYCRFSSAVSHGCDYLESAGFLSHEKAIGFDDFLLSGQYLLVQKYVTETLQAAT
jgi:hypothetical protein